MLLRHTLLYLPAQLLAPLSQFIAAVVWTHWMSPESYGVLTFLIAAQDLVYMLCLHWWSSFSLRFLPGFNRGEARDYRRSEATILVATVFVGALVTIALLGYLGILSDVPLIAIAVIFLASRAINVHLAERARAQERILAYTVAQTAGPVLGFALALAAVHWLRPTPDAALAGFAVAQTFATFWLSRHLSVDLALRSPDPTMLRRAVVYGAPMVVAGVLGWFALNGVRFVVQEMGGDAAVGLVAVGWNLGQRLTGVTAMLVTAAAYPLVVRQLATQGHKSALAQLEAGGTLLLAVMLPASVGLWQISSLLVDLMVAEPFKAVTMAILPTVIVAGSIRNFRVHYADQPFLLFERTRLGMLINTVEVLALVIFAAIGFAWRGIPGAIDGCLVATCIGALLAFILARRLFALPLPVFDWGRIGLAAGVMAAAVLWADRLPLSTGTQVVVDIAVGAAAYSVALAALFADRIRSVLRARRLDGQPLVKGA